MATSTAPLGSAASRIGVTTWWLGWGLIALGVALAANSLLGPFAADRIDYPVSETMRNQTIGLDAATLLVAAPLVVVAGALTLRGRRLGPVLALGPTSYGAYLFVQYVAGPDHLVYPRVLLLQLTIFGASWLLAALAWQQARRRAVVAEEPVAGWHGLVAFALAGFVVLRYVPGLVGSLTREPLPDEVAGDPAMFWLIVLLDLGVFVPVAVATGLGLLARAPWASTLHRAIVNWFALVTVAVAAMSTAMYLDDDPFASFPQLVMFLIIGIAVIGYGVALHRPLVDPRLDQ